MKWRIPLSSQSISCTRIIPDVKSGCSNTSFPLSIRTRKSSGGRSIRFRAENTPRRIADTKGIFEGKERKAPSEQIQRTEKEIAAKPDKLSDILKEDGYPDVQAFMRTFREMEGVVEQYNRDLAEWERQTNRKSKNADKQQRRPPEHESILKRLHQIQTEGRQRNQPRRRKKSADRDSR